MQKLPKKHTYQLTFSIQLRRSYQYFSSAPKLTPREKIEFEVMHIPIKKMLNVSSKQNGARFSIILRGLTLIFTRMLKNLIAG